MNADIAVRNDRAGIAVAHVKRWDEVPMIGTDRDGGAVKLRERRPVVKVDPRFTYQSTLVRTLPWTSRSGGRGRSLPEAAPADPSRRRFTADGSKDAAAALACAFVAF